MSDTEHAAAKAFGEENLSRSRRVETFARRDVVYLLSGGAGMTVEHVMPTDKSQFAERGALVECSWFEGKKLRRKKFFADLLTRTDPKAAPVKPPMPNETERDK